MTGRCKVRIGLLIALCAFRVTSPLLRADNQLTASGDSKAVLKIQLENDQLVAGLQFVLRSSSNVVMHDIQRAGRTSSGGWIVVGNRINDSVMSVVIVGAEAISFGAGSGVVAEVPLSASGLSGSIGFDHVFAADPQAHLVDISTKNLSLDFRSSASALTSKDISIGQNFPNPFNPSTRVSYQLRKGGDVRLAIYDIAGREVSVLVNQYQPEGSYSVVWNASDGRWGHLATGTYVARLQVGHEVVSRKMILTK